MHRDQFPRADESEKLLFDDTDSLSHPDYEIEIQLLADTVFKALELGDSMELKDIYPSSSQVTLSVPPELLKTVTKMPVDTSVFGPNVELDLEYGFNTLGSRPSLEVRFSDDFEDSGLPLSVAVINKSGGDLTSMDIRFTGELRKVGMKPDTLDVNPDLISDMIQDLVTPRGFIMDQTGVASLEAFKEIIADPQHPPVANFIKETLIEKGASSVIKHRYELDVDQVRFEVSTVSEDGRIMEVEIVETLLEDVSVSDTGDITHVKSSIGARVSHTLLKQAIEFFKVGPNGEQTTIKGDHGNILRLREQLELLSNRV